jgi:hypothetical protein
MKPQDHSKLGELLSEDLFLKMARSAAKAPSGHNTQPWLFSKTGGDTFVIQPDFRRALPVADADHHELYISLGCAAENAALAAAYHGYATHCEIEERAEETVIKLRLAKDELPEDGQLFLQIDRRQTTRREYEPKTVPPTALQAWQEAINGDGIALKFFRDPAEIAPLSDYILQANQAQFSNPAFVQELIEWIRFSSKEAGQQGDGVWTSTSGVPSLGRPLGSWVMRRFVTAQSEAKRWRKLIEKSAGFALFMTQDNRPEGWIKLGRAFQRFALLATAMGISHAHVNMPCEVEPVREKMARRLGLPGYTPLLLIRFGYAQPMPYSKRRRLDEVIVSSAV